MSGVPYFIDIEVYGENGIEELIYAINSNTVSGIQELATKNLEVLPLKASKKPGVLHKKSELTGSKQKISKVSSSFSTLSPCHQTSLRSELKSSLQNYLTKFRIQFPDVRTKKTFKIVDVQLSHGVRGTGSKTPFYKMYVVALYLGSPLSDADREYMPCAKLL